MDEDRPSGATRLSMLVLAMLGDAGCASTAPSCLPDDDIDLSLPTIPVAARLPMGLEIDDAEDPAVAAPAGDEARDLCVTSGVVSTTGSALHVDGGMRAVLRSAHTPKAVELGFLYKGASAVAEPLANGEVRRQIGLKLRAQDTCNLVYVMWQVAPTPGVFVSVKSNPGQATHAECGDHGYINVAPATVQQPSIVKGAAHVLRTELHGRHLRVFADDAIAWEGDLPAAALGFDGPAGVRSDNGSFDFEIEADEPRTGACAVPD